MTAGERGAQPASPGLVWCLLGWRQNVDSGEQRQPSAPSLSWNCFHCKISLQAPFSPPSHHCTVREGTTGRQSPDVDLPSTGSSAWVSSCGGHCFPATCSPLPSPPPGLANWWCTNGSQNLSNKKQPSRSPAWGYLCHVTIPPQILSTVFWQSTRWGHSTQTHADWGVSLGVTTHSKDPQRDLGLPCLEEQAVAGGIVEGLRPRWPWETGILLSSV